MILLITNEGIFTEVWEDKKFTNPLPKGIHHYYADSIIFASDLTLGGFLNTMYKYKEIIEHDFASYLHNLELQPFYDQMSKDADRKIDHTSLILKHSCSINVHQVEGQFRNYVNAWSYTIGIDKTNVYPNITLSYTELNNLKDLPFSLDTLYNLWSINPLEKDVLLAKDLIHHFTLFEVIAAVMEDLTFCGYPSHDIDNELNENDWDKLKSIDELIMQDLQSSLIEKKDELNSALEQQQYEKCGSLAKEIERLETVVKSRIEAKQ